MEAPLGLRGSVPLVHTVLPTPLFSRLLTLAARSAADTDRDTIVEAARHVARCVSEPALKAATFETKRVACAECGCPAHELDLHHGMCGQCIYTVGAPDAADLGPHF